jgi:hypothetical protein
VLFFVNAAFVDNRRLALPNLACYVANVFGMRTINEAARIAQAGRWGPIETLGELSTRFLARASLDQRQAFFEALLRLNGINELQTTGAAALYITAKQLREIAAAGVEIGNHTYTHVHCRTLRQADFAAEIDRNRAELEALSNRLVRAFSVPYGSSKDLTSELAQHLERSGYDAIFLSENAANLHGAGRRRLDRLSIRGSSPYGIIRDLEILPPLRTLRNRLRVGLRQNK